MQRERVSEDASSCGRSIDLKKNAHLLSTLGVQWKHVHLLTASVSRLPASVNQLTVPRPSGGGSKELLAD